MKNALFNQPSCKAIDQSVGKKSLFVTGLGVNKAPGVPLRFAAYLIPLLDLLKSEDAARGQFYIADQAAVRIGQDPQQVLQNTSQMMSFFSVFVSSFFPDLLDRVEMVQEKSRELPHISERRASFRAKLVDILLSSKSDKILSFAQKRVNPNDPEGLRTPLEYMAEHGLFMRDPLTDDKEIYLVKDPDFAYEQLVMIGGPSEKIFFETRMLLLEKLGKLDQASPQLFTDVGRIPCYYRFGSEPLIGDEMGNDSVESFLKKRKELTPDIFSDFLVLFSYLSDVQDMKSMISRRNSLKSEDYSLLQRGYDRLLSLITQKSYANV